MIKAFAIVTLAFVGTMGLRVGESPTLEEIDYEVVNEALQITDSLGVSEESRDTIHINRNTAYHPVVSQCQGNPLVTADMSKIDLAKLKNKQIRWVALSRDLIKRWGGPINYGDTIVISSEVNSQLNGEWIVHDCMNARYKKSIDFLFHSSNKSGIVWPNKTDLKIIY